MNIKRTIYGGISALLIVFLIYVIGIFFGFGSGNNEPNPENYSWPIYQLEQAYHKIHHGMTQAQVISIAGVPDGQTDTELWWRYSSETNNSNLYNDEWYALWVSFSNNCVSGVAVGKVDRLGDVISMGGKNK